LALDSSACLKDPAQPCAEHQAPDDRGLCACVAGYVLDVTKGGTRCAPCGANEIAQANQCVCAPEFARATPTGPCEKLAAGLGNPCKADGECTSAPFTHCRIDPGKAGYCTNAMCAADADCMRGYGCDKGAAPPSCKAPPTGQGKPCASGADCAGLDASFCEIYTSRVCIVEGCKVGDPSGCHPSWRCCDLTHLGLPKTICIPNPVCP
jgi:hypothetical protein